MQLITELTNKTPLPMEIWLKIVYKHKGFITPSALLIKNEMKKYNKYEQIDLLIKEYPAMKYSVHNHGFNNITSKLNVPNTKFMMSDYGYNKYYYLNEQEKFLYIKNNFDKGYLQEEHRYFLEDFWHETYPDILERQNLENNNYYSDSDSDSDSDF